MSRQTLHELADEATEALKRLIDVLGDVCEDEAEEGEGAEEAGKGATTS